MPARNISATPGPGIKRLGLSFLVLTCTGVAVALAGHDTGELLPLDDDAIRYTKTTADDPVARLQQRLIAGSAKLTWEDQFGYLRSALKELHVSPVSQVLVFSKTSFQAARISPRRPRAVYFNDTVTVGYVRTGDVLEFAAADPRQGTIFYTLEQQQTTRPRFYRRDVCIQCHHSPVTQAVPGFMVRSVTPDWNGFPSGTEAFITDHRSPLKERWGGWYVTGTSGDQDHMGNAVLQRPGETRLAISGESRNISSLRAFIEPEAYPAPHSDIVALMTLEHQSQMLNRITRLGWESRLGRPIEPLVEELVEYALFSGEATLTAPVKGTSGFTEEFARQAPRDSKGRSLYDFDLTTRMFRYPCSFLIYSEPWDGMPALVKERVYARLGEVLSGADQTAKFRHLTKDDRRAIREILQATKKGLPATFARED